MEQELLSYYQRNKEKIKANQREYYSKKSKLSIKVRNVVIVQNVRVSF